MGNAVQDNRIKRARKDMERGRTALAAAQVEEAQTWLKQARQRLAELDGNDAAVRTLADEIDSRPCKTSAARMNRAIPPKSIHRNPLEIEIIVAET